MAEVPVFDGIVYLFQGGGSLGAYQVGVIKGLLENNYAPDWVIGTSIGAINSAIIAGNLPKDRIKKLETFWTSIATNIPRTPNMMNNVLLERMEHFYSAQNTLLTGQPNFFTPRPINPWFSIESTVDKLSFYEIEPLRENLKKLINFDLINDQKVRLSVGAVRVDTGELVYFDNKKITITLDHILASGALPPAFPAIKIDDKYYWDGGLHSNTQLNLLLSEQKEPLKYLCFMVHLFDSYGMMPENMDDLLKRQKDINYSSHHKQSIQVYRNIHNLRHAIRVLGDNIPKEKLSDPEIQKLLTLARVGVLHITRFHCKGKSSDLSSKDYNFSLPTLLDLFSYGERDVCKILNNPPWQRPCPLDVGLFLYEIADAPIEDVSIYDENNVIIS